MKLLIQLLLFVVIFIKSSCESFDCPFFNVSNTNYDTQNYGTCGVNSCGESTLIISQFSSTGGSCFGDKSYLILFDEIGNQLTSTPQYENLCAQLKYTTNLPSSQCQTYIIKEGCYSSGSCGGVVNVQGGTYVEIPPYSPPTFIPTLSPVPSVPTVSPTTNPTYTENSPTPEPTFSPSIIHFNCPAYNVTNTNYALFNYDVCGVRACANTLLILSECEDAGGYCSGDDSFWRLFNESGFEVDYVQDFEKCGNCSRISYTTPANSICQNYSIHEGCYSNENCAGIIAISGGSEVNVTEYIAPSSIPTILPTEEPTHNPAYKPPTLSPTKSPYLCKEYSVVNTNNAQQNFDTCFFYGCPGDSIVISLCSLEGGICSQGDTYLRLLNSSNLEVSHNDDYCSVCSQITYEPPKNSDCQEYTIIEGCYSSGSCGGIVSVTGSTYFGTDPTVLNNEIIGIVLILIFSIAITFSIAYFLRKRITSRDSFNDSYKESENWSKRLFGYDQDTHYSDLLNEGPSSSSNKNRYSGGMFRL